MDALVQLYTALVALIPFEAVRNSINILIPPVALASMVLGTVFYINLVGKKSNCFRSSKIRSE
jgi:hypothetical protein